MKRIFRRFGVRIKLSLVLLVVLVVPVTGILFWIQPQNTQEFNTCLAIYLACSVTFFYPLGAFASYLVIIKELKEINTFCLKVREGKRTHYFNLPNQTENEDEVWELKRNLNWMLRSVSGKEKRLQRVLKEESLNKEKYQNLSLVDPLTRVYNRRFFDYRIADAVTQAMETQDTLILMLIDADKFKVVNDRFGHQAGDDLLIKLGANIMGSIRSEKDFAFRYGGDEFGVIFSDVDMSVVEKVAQRIRHRYFEDRVGNTTLSMGAARYHSQDKSITKQVQQFIRICDDACYMAKRRGGDMLVVFDNGLFRSSEK